MLPAETCPHLKSASALNQEQRWRIFVADWQIACARWLLVECPPKENNAMLQQAVTSTLPWKEEEEWLYLCFCYHDITNCHVILKTWCYLILIIFGAFPYWNWIQVSGSIKDPGPLSVLSPNKLTWQSPLPPFPSLIWISRHSLRSHQPTHFEFLLTRFNFGKCCYKNEMSWYCSYFSLFPSFTGWEENKLCGAFSFVPVNFARRHKQEQIQILEIGFC